MKKVTYLFCILFLLASCKVNQYTGKKTFNFYGNKTVFPMAFKEYSAFLEQNEVIENTRESDQINRVGKKITAAAEAYFQHKGNLAVLKDYAWEYNLVKNDQRNAWCMPGGKIVFYTGILPTAKTEAGIAAIMGHEVAHALADHGAQRMSANTAKVGMDFLVGRSVKNQPEDKQKKILAAYGIGSHVAGILPFSRKHETEADRIGLELMTIAGYAPKEAADLWRRMHDASEGKTPPEILSTHPSSLRRIRNIEAHIPVADSLAAVLQKN